jgi:phosphopantothenoylcysteine decarboxylase/phosphopantothenate--cysteine ligase
MKVKSGNLVLGVSGSIAAYRAADLARDLMRAGFTVRVCLTDAAQKFVTPVLFETLTGQPCLIDTFDEPDQGRMAHIDWARQAEIMLIAPASANTINKIANGYADDMLSTIALAYTGPIIIAPAMNPTMYAHETTRESMDILRARAATIVEPQEGDVVAGEHGPGKLAANDDIVQAVLTVHNRSQLLKGKKVLITSGPTQEPIDSVRFLTNRSSGKMGASLARAALLMGADVTIVTGPTKEPTPLQAKTIHVTTAEQMLGKALAEAKSADIIIGAAAVADYKPAAPLKGKVRRSNEPMHLDLVPNPDVIAELAKVAKKDAKVIGFAAEPDQQLETAAQKIIRKGLTGIAVNDISKPEIGFNSDENELTLIHADGRTESSGRQSKLGCALWLLARILA